MVGGAVVAYYAEHPINPEFATFGDSLWWSVVTLTTVGYGDIVPETLSGRMAAVMIMFTGVAVLGLLAGSLASFFRLQPAGSDTDQEPSEPSEPSEPAAPSTSTQPGPSTDPITRPGLEQVLSELAHLRTQVGELTELKAQIAALSADLAPSARKDA